MFSMPRAGKIAYQMSNVKWDIELLGCLVHVLIFESSPVKDLSSSTLSPVKDLFGEDNWSLKNTPDTTEAPT